MERADRRWLGTVGIARGAAGRLAGVAAEPRDAKDAVQEIAALNTDMTHFSTILRLSEDIAFWQSVLVTGSENEWEFDYDAQGGGIGR